MAQKTISSSGSSWTGTASADQAYISFADRVRLNTASGNDSIYNYWGWYETIDAGAGNDTINLYYGNYSSIDAGDGNDRISLNGASSGVITLKSGKGNDTVYGSGNKTLHQYANGDGNDVIYNWSANDTLSITGGTYTRSTVGNDVVLKVGSGAVTLKGAKGTTVNVRGELYDEDDDIIIEDTVYWASFNNSTSNKTVNGTSRNDSIKNNYGANYVTINAGKGNDTVSLNSSGHHNVIKYASGDGNDVIYNLGSTDTISITGGTYTRSTVGNDVVLKVGSGSITLKNAKGQTLNISNLSSSADLVSSADLASDDWISADDNNFITNDTRLDSVVETSATDYSVGNLYSATTSLTPRNIFVTFASKK